MSDKCPRVEMRMECPECGYSLSEATLPLDKELPHMLTDSQYLIDAVTMEYLGKQIDYEE